MKVLVVVERQCPPGVHVKAAVLWTHSRHGLVEEFVVVISVRNCEDEVGAGRAQWWPVAQRHVVEAVRHSCTRGSVPPEVVLANHRCVVAQILLKSRDHLLAVLRRQFAVREHAVIPRLHASQQCGPGRRANRSGRVRLLELYALLGELVEIWRGRCGVSVGGQDVPAYLVRQDHQDVGLLALCEGEERSDRQEG